MKARHPGTTHAVDDELTRLVARIRAREIGQVLPKPAPEAVASFLAHTEHG